MESTGRQLSFEVIRDVGEQIREHVETQMRSSILRTVMQLFDDEVTRLCGKHFSRKGGKLFHRGGSDPGSVLAQGQRVAVRKPRVRSDGEDVELETYKALRNYDVLCDRVMDHMIEGVSTRGYDRVVEEISNGSGLKKSSVSKAFVRASKGALDEVNHRDLKNYNFTSLMIDGLGFGTRTVVCAIGITIDGEKLVLGLREGDTENWELARDLFENLIARGLKPEDPMLFVIDGGKALKKAIIKVFAKNALVQRCVRHKERNILMYLPKERHQEFRRRWKMIHGFSSFHDAKKHHDDLHRWLTEINMAAAQSLDEANWETLTVLKLNLPALLRKTFLSTNPLESAFSVARHKVLRVKNWRSGTDQVSRWAATMVLETETKFRRIRGCAQMALLVEALKKVKLENETQVA